MSLSITGYILDPPRVGTANSPFTLTPDNLISNQVAFDAAYPSDESAPRAEYLVQVLEEVNGTATGPGGNRSLPDALFLWTKNEGDIQAGTQVPFQRFDFSGQDGRFIPLLGGLVSNVGTLALDANTTRLLVTPIPLLTDLTKFPIRLSVGTNPGISATTFTVTLVTTEGSFGSPAAGTVELARDTGSLNWNVLDLATYEGRDVFYQRQAFHFPDESTGSVGVIGTDTLVLNPRPRGASGQIPLLRFDAGPYVTVSEVTSFGAPAAGTIEWDRNTGVLNLSAADLVTYADQRLFYDGVALATFQIPSTSIGTINSPGTLSFTDEAEDIFFRIPNVVQFSETKFVDSFGSGKKGVVQVRRGDGQVLFSSSDINKYTGQTVHVVRPDVTLENGHALRFFRTPVDLGATDDTIKDVSAFYVSDGATLADPIVGAPFVLLPKVPRTDLALDVVVEQGTGSFTGPLNRLDVASPPAGRGYTLDLDNRYLYYAERKEDQIQTAPINAYGAFQLPNYPVFQSNLVIELEDNPGVGDWQTLTVNNSFTIDYNSGTCIFTQTDGSLILEESADSASGNILSDPLVDFPTLGVIAGDYLLLPSGASQGVYLITGVAFGALTVDPSFPVAVSNVGYEIRRGHEVLADRYFRTVPPLDPNTKVERLNILGTATNSPRLTIDPSKASSYRFRFDKTGGFSTTVVVSNNGAFTPPLLLAAGTVQVSLSTGDLNFSTSDLGKDIYSALELELGEDYQVQSGLGFIEFTERLLVDEEVYLSYAHLEDDGSKTLVEERGAILVSKELVQPHPSTTSTLSFNPDGKEVAALPVPRAFRGGRPQVTGEQVTFNTTASTVQFLASDQVTDALPSGPVGPTENVYIDYYIVEAIGGEKNISVIQPPMATVQVVINEGDTSFTIEGDRTADFQANFLLRVDGQEMYLLAAPSYSGGLTTVTLDQLLPQAFKTDFNNPTLEVTSGATRRVASGSLPSYFQLETATFNTIARGSKTFKIQGDLARTYTTGTAICFTDGSGFQDYNLVEGAEYDETSGLTKVTLLGNCLQQYGSGTSLYHSVRAILPTPEASAFTSKAPFLDLPVTVYRQIEGQPGVLLIPGVDYTIDESGRVTFTDPLTLNEELGIFYTGVVLVDAGRRVRASWTHSVVPSLSNGLLNQILKMSYTTYAPDTFFYRVETLTNYRGELVERLSESAKSNSPSQGPILENSSSNRLFEQGNESLYYNEGDLDNQDLVARPTLKYYNDSINYLEDYLQACDGRVVGDRDGRFLFDGLTDNPIRATFADATNQIDDEITLFASFFYTRTVTAYLASSFSRFYPKRRVTLGDTLNTAGLSTGDPIYDTGYSPLTAVNTVRRRFPFAMVTARAASGSTILTVDDADGRSEYVRPAFLNGVEIVILAQDGTVLDGTGKTVSSSTATSITLSGGVATAIPAGSTIVLADTDTTYRQDYFVGVDVKVNSGDGLLTYLESTSIFPPFTAKTFFPVEQWDVIVNTFHDDTEPFRFPGLDGGTSDDDGDIQTPLLTPQAKSELGFDPVTAAPNGAGLLSREASYITDIQSFTTAPFQGVGNVAGTTLTLTSPATFPLTPRRGDLVRILDGTLGPSSYYRVSSATASTITLATSPGSASGFNFTVTAVASINTGSGLTVSTSGTTFTNTAANFISAGVRPGHAVVVTSGLNDLQRRQVASVTSATVLVLTTAFTNVTSNFTYRIDGPTNTYGQATSSSLALWLDVLAEEVEVLDTDPASEITSLEGYVSQVGTLIAGSSNGAASLPSTFTDATANFVVSQVAATDFLFIRSGANAAFYSIASIDDPNNITINESFVSAGGGITYQILRTTGVSKDGLDEVMAALLNADAALTNASAFSVSTVPVVGDASAYATDLTAASLTGRAAQVTARLAEAEADASNISSVMSSIDRLYDTRFVWIDARINLETGILVKKTRAVKSRQKALKQIIKDLTKLLTT